MKKKLITTIFIFMLLVSLTWASAIIYSTTSGEKTSSELIHTGKAGLTAILVATNGTDNATVIVYDNTSATGTVVFECTVKGADHYGGRIYTPYPLKVQNGIYVAVSGTGASYWVEYFGAS